MISVIIPTYNGAGLIQKYSLPSLLKQTYTDWEALIIDDGSTDNSSEIIKKLITHDKRFRLIERPANSGLAAALNLGLRESRGSFIAILEHDDIWLPDKLEKQVQVLASGARVSSTNAIIYSQARHDFSKINGGNFSCLALTREAADLIFPLPEENKKYLGIEDGLVAARLAIARCTKKIQESEFSHISEALTIMNSGTETLSGLKDSLVMKNRYQNALDLFSKDKGKYPEVDALISFWKKHYYYNNLLSYCPPGFKKIVYYITYKLYIIKNGRSLKTFRQTAQYQKLKSYRVLFD